MKITIGVDASRALQSAQHKVFVEGSSDDEIDPIVISELLRNNELPQIEVRPMGGCENVRSAAFAMVYYHPSYYFIIDRDDQDEQQVEASWRNFPDPNKANLLIWRKRELENYFIDPDYISKSDSLKSSCSVDKLRTVIINEANRRVFLDAANLTLLYLHRYLRTPFCEHFKQVSDFCSKEDGYGMLAGLTKISQKKSEVDREFSPVNVKSVYERFLGLLTGGITPLKYGTGEWLNLMSGKEIFRAISGQCFTVEDRNGIKVQGKAQNLEVAKGLLRLPLESQPEDFKILVEKIKERVIALS